MLQKQMSNIMINIVDFVDLHILSLFSERWTVSSIWEKMPLWVYLILLMTVVFKIYLNHKWSYWHKRGIDGPAPGIFRLGNMTDIIKSISKNSKLREEWVEKYGSVIGIYFFGSPTLIITDLDILREINIKQFSKFPLRNARSGFDTLFGPLSADFMSTISDAQWRRIRQTTAPLMSQAKLSDLVPLLKMAADVVSQQHIMEDEEYDTKELSGTYTIKAIMSSAFNIDPYDKKAMDEGEKYALQVLPEGYSFTRMLLLSLIPEKIRFYFELHVCSMDTIRYFTNLFDYLLDEHIKLRNSGHKGSKNLSSHMMESIIDDEDKFNEKVVKGFTKMELKSNSLLFILAGHETTATVLQFLLFELVNNPEIQDQLYAHIKSFDKLSYENIRDFKLLDAVIKETMRLYPPAPQNSRYCTETAEVSDTLTIEKGTTVLWINSHFHYSEEYYENPHKFDPSRWEGNESTTLQDEHWFGFGQGPRSCPGVRLAYLNMKMFIIILLTEYHIITCEKTPKVVDISLKGMKVVSSPPIVVKFKKRVK